MHEKSKENTKIKMKSTTKEATIQIVKDMYGISNKGARNTT